MLKIGETAPVFTLHNQNGERVSLSDFAGRRVVLYFYPKAGTTGCTLEAREFAALSDDFARAGAVVIGVSRDSVAAQKRFAEKNDLPFILLSDPDHAVTEEYGAWGEKTMYGKRVQGTVRSTYIIGTDGKILAAYTKVRSAGHAAAVLADLRGL